jgi:hypothetical protein
MNDNEAYKKFRELQGLCGTAVLSGWIDVKKRLPSPNKKVIVYTCNGKMIITSHDGKYWHGSGTFQKSVTHWCYLPDAPNKDNVL